MQKLIATAGLILLASCAPATAPTTVAAAPASPVPAVAARSCVSLTSISEARVIDDRTIDFHMRDGTVLKNTLPHSCPSLGFEKAFTYATSLSQLCSVDIISVIQQGGGPRIGASCGLGTFVPTAVAAR
jgi:hypothetical protein